MPYADLIHDVRVLVGGSPARKTPDYYASLAKQYAQKAMEHANESMLRSKDAEVYAVSAEASAQASAESSKASEAALKEVIIMRDACKKYYEHTKQVAESIEDIEINIITDEDIDEIMEENYGR